MTFGRPESRSLTRPPRPAAYFPRLLLRRFFRGVVRRVRCFLPLAWAGQGGSPPGSGQSPASFRQRLATRNHQHTTEAVVVITIHGMFVVAIRGAQFERIVIDPRRAPQHPERRRFPAVEPLLLHRRHEAAGPKQNLVFHVLCKNEPIVARIWKPGSQDRKAEHPVLPGFMASKFIVSIEHFHAQKIFAACGAAHRPPRNQAHQAKMVKGRKHLSDQKPPAHNGSR